MKQRRVNGALGIAGGFFKKLVHQGGNDILMLLF